MTDWGIHAGVGPGRIIYAITRNGQKTVRQWTDTMLSTPAREFQSAPWHPQQPSHRHVHHREVQVAGQSAITPKISGAIVRWLDWQLDFAAQQRRYTQRRRAAEFAVTHPGHLVLFDVLETACDGPGSRPFLGGEAVSRGRPAHEAASSHNMASQILNWRPSTNRLMPRHFELRRVYATPIPTAPGTHYAALL